MNTIITILLFITPFVFINAQDTTKVDAPKIICKLKAGNTIEFDSKSLKFVKVIEDSRCPSGVDCMWAGEVKILIGFYENNSLIEEKEFVFSGKAGTPNDLKEIMLLDKKTVYGYSISPYPSSENTIDPSAYSLELIVK